MKKCFISLVMDVSEFYEVIEDWKKLKLNLSSSFRQVLFYIWKYVLTLDNPQTSIYFTASFTRL